MATHASAIKRYRQSEKREIRNRWWKSRVRSAVREVTEAVEKKNKKAAAESLKKATKEIGKAKKNGILHASTASRKVARLSKQVAKL